MWKICLKLLKICLKSMGNMFQICPDSVHHMSDVSLKSCKIICHYPSKSAKIYRILAEILLKVWQKCDLQNLSNNCPNMFKVCSKYGHNLFAKCPNYVEHLLNVGSKYVGKYVQIRFKICSKTHQNMSKICGKSVQIYPKYVHL